MYELLIDSSSLSLIFPVLVMIMRFRYYGKSLQIICALVTVAAITQVAVEYFWARNENNLFLLHIYTLLEFEIISLFYFLLLKEYVARWIIPLLMAAFFALSLADALLWHGWQRFNTYARSTECVIVMAYTLYYFAKQLEQAQLRSMRKEPVSLINMAFLVYFSVCFFLFLFSNLIVEAQFTRRLMWGTHTIALWILYTTIGIALWKAGRK
jgi:hypothetical protein